MRNSVFVTLSFVLAACDESRPPARTSPELEAIDGLTSEPVNWVIRSDATFVIGTDGTLWRIADGSAQQLASGGPGADSRYPWYMAVAADETVWTTVSIDNFGTADVDRWDGSAWTTLTVPGVDNCDAVAARSANDAIVACEAGSEDRFCRWDGATWSCEAVDVGLPSHLYTTTSDYLWESDGILLRLDPTSTVDAAEVVVSDIPGNLFVLEDGEMFAMLETPGESVEVFHWDGSAFQSIFTVAIQDSPRLAVRSASDLWIADVLADDQCVVESAFGEGCVRRLSIWRQHVVHHWDGASVEEVGHVDRQDDVEWESPGIPPLFRGALLPAAPGRAWLDAEGWVEAVR